MNQTRQRSNFKENEVVFVKDRQILLGIPRPLKTVYSLSPYVVVQPKYTTTLVRRLADNFQQVYHNKDIKRYKALDPMFEDLPKEVKEVLEKDFLSLNVTSKDLKLLQQHDPLDLPDGIDLINDLNELREITDPDQVEINNQEESSDSETDDEDDPPERTEGNADTALGQEENLTQNDTIDRDTGGETGKESTQGLSTIPEQTEARGKSKRAHNTRKNPAKKVFPGFETYGQGIRKYTKGLVGRKKNK